MKCQREETDEQAPAAREAPAGINLCCLCWVPQHLSSLSVSELPQYLSSLSVSELLSTSLIHPIHMKSVVPRISVHIPTAHSLITLGSDRNSTTCYCAQTSRDRIFERVVWKGIVENEKLHLITYQHINNNTASHYMADCAKGIFMVVKNCLACMFSILLINLMRSF